MRSEGLLVRCCSIPQYRKIYLLIRLVVVAGAIWTNTMPDKLAKYLPFLTEEQRAKLYGSIVEAAANPRGDPIREGVIKGV